MFSDKQKSKYAMLITEGASFNSVSNKLNNPGLSSIYALALLKMKINIYNKILEYEEKIYIPFSVEKSLTVVPNDILTDVFSEYKPSKRIRANLIKCHSFVIFFGVIFKYFIVLSIPKMLYVNFL